MYHIQRTTASYFYNRIINNSKKQRFLNIILLKLFELLRKSILIITDPLIEFKIGRFVIFIPFSHNLPLSMVQSENYAINLGRIAKLVQQKYQGLHLIDIGANIGDSIAVLRSEAEFPILCIEGEEHFFRILRKNASLFPNVHLVMSYVGDVTGEFGKEITRDGGSARICHDTILDLPPGVKSDISTKAIRIRTLEDIVEHEKRFKMSKMIKIDTDGYDCKIIRGAINFLGNVKPVIFFEYDPYLLTYQEDDGLSVFKILNNIGYYSAIIYDNFGKYMFSTSLNNQILLREIHNYFSGRQGKFYADICVFHSEDTDLFEDVRTSEIQYFESLITKKIW